MRRRWGKACEMDFAAIFSAGDGQPRMAGRNWNLDRARYLFIILEILGSEIDAHGYLVGH